MRCSRGCDTGAGALWVEDAPPWDHSQVPALGPGAASKGESVLKHQMPAGAGEEQLGWAHSLVWALHGLVRVARDRRGAWYVHGPPGADQLGLGPRAPADPSSRTGHSPAPGCLGWPSAVHSAVTRWHPLHPAAGWSSPHLIFSLMAMAPCYCWELAVERRRHREHVTW